MKGLLAYSLSAFFYSLFSFSNLFILFYLSFLSFTPTAGENKGKKSKKKWKKIGINNNEPTWRCQQNPFIGALGIQEPVILGEPQI